jgi:hypothetical protein
MTYASWEPRYRVASIEPGKLDLLVVTLIDGKRAALCSVLDYDAAVAKARAFAAEHQCQIKVLPLTGPEARNFLDLTPDDPPSELDPVMRAEMVECLLTVARDSSDSDARRDAHDLLTEWGVISK